MNLTPIRIQQRLLEPWVITEPALRLILQNVLATHRGAMAWDREEPALKPTALTYTVENGVAVLPIQGAMAKGLDDFEKAYLGMTDMNEVVDAIDAALADGSVRSIMLDINSPGGTVNGTPELAEAVASADAKKPVVAFTDGMMASAAYFVGSQASVVLGTKSSNVGSIGTVLGFYDVTKMLEQWGVKAEVFTNADSPLKATGWPGKELTDEQRAYLQQRVDVSGMDFKATVLAKRSVDPKAMQGQVVWGNEAVRCGFLDQNCDRKTAKKTAAQLAQMRR